MTICRSYRQPRAWGAPRGRTLPTTGVLRRTPTRPIFASYCCQQATLPALTAALDAPNSKEAMHSDEPRTSAELGPEEVGARVSAILEAAERDARAVISAAYREQPQEPAAGLGELAQTLARLEARVEALEQALAASASEGDVQAPQRVADVGAQVARVRAVELALAGLSREAIAAELSATMEPAEVERLLDDVLSG